MKSPRQVLALILLGLIFSGFTDGCPEMVNKTDEEFTTCAKNILDNDVVSQCKDTCYKKKENLECGKVCANGEMCKQLGHSYDLLCVGVSCKYFCDDYQGGKTCIALCVGYQECAKRKKESRGNEFGYNCMASQSKAFMALECPLLDGRKERKGSAFENAFYNCLKAIREMNGRNSTELCKRLPFFCSKLGNMQDVVNPIKCSAASKDNPFAKATMLLCMQEKCAETCRSSDNQKLCLSKCFGHGPHCFEEYSDVEALSCVEDSLDEFRADFCPPMDIYGDKLSTELMGNHTPRQLVANRNRDYLFCLKKVKEADLGEYCKSHEVVCKTAEERKEIGCTRYWDNPRLSTQLLCLGQKCWEECEKFPKRQHCMETCFGDVHGCLMNVSISRKLHCIEDHVENFLANPPKLAGSFAVQDTVNLAVIVLSSINLMKSALLRGRIY